MKRTLAVVTLALIGALSVAGSRIGQAQEAARSEWEIVADKNPKLSFTTSKGRVTERMRVPGGWIYQTTVVTIGDAGGVAMAMVFVPDPTQK